MANAVYTASSDQRLLFLLFTEGIFVHPRPAGGRHVMHHESSQRVTQARPAPVRGTSPEHPLARSVDRAPGPAIFDLSTQGQHGGGEDARGSSGDQRVHARVDRRRVTGLRQFFPRRCQ
jgi:hypothetical protein